MADAAGVPLPLTSLRGACTAGELTLASDSLPFGTVVLGSRSSKRLTLSNTGDMGVRFAWDVKALGPHFSILPSGEWVSPRPHVCGRNWSGSQQTALPSWETAVEALAVGRHEMSRNIGSQHLGAPRVRCVWSSEQLLYRTHAHLRLQMVSCHPARTSSWRWCSSQWQWTLTYAWRVAAAGAGDRRSRFATVTNACHKHQSVMFWQPGAGMYSLSARGVAPDNRAVFLLQSRRRARAWADPQPDGRLLRHERPARCRDIQVGNAAASSTMQLACVLLVLFATQVQLTLCRWS